MFLEVTHAVYGIQLNKIHIYLASCSPHKAQGAVSKSNLDNTTTTKMAGLVKGIANQARSVVRDLDPINEMTFLRLRSNKTEFLIAPGAPGPSHLPRQGLRAGGAADSAR